MTGTTDREDEGRREATIPAHAPRRIRSAELLRSAPEIVIEHQGAEYRLKVTSQGKLILTK